MTGTYGAQGPLGPGEIVHAEGALDFGYTTEELQGLLVGIADQLLQTLQARANRLTQDPQTALEVEIRSQMVEAAYEGRYDEVQRLTDLRLHVLRVASQFAPRTTQE